VAWWEVKEEVKEAVKEEKDRRRDFRFKSNLNERAGGAVVRGRRGGGEGVREETNKVLIELKDA
jgi:hypothetical protein